MARMENAFSMRCSSSFIGIKNHYLVNCVMSSSSIPLLPPEALGDEVIKFTVSLMVASNTESRLQLGVNTKIIS